MEDATKIRAIQVGLELIKGKWVSVDLGDATNKETTTHVGLEFVGNGYSRLGLSYRLTRVGLEKAARNWIQLELDSRGQQDNG